MAQLKNTTISDTGNLSLPSGTTEQRPASPLQGMIRYNTTVNNTEYYDGTTWRSISDTGVEATGGTIIDTEIGGVAYRIHQFTATGNTTFTVTKGGEVEYLIVAGGGGGGEGGGGGGGLLTGVTTLTPQPYTVTVGAGGTGSSNGVAVATNGSNSIAFGLTAIGGGAGGVTTSGAGVAGGSGGGGRRDGAGVGGAGTAGQGFAGGNSLPPGAWKGAGGGGGVGAVGGLGTSNGESTGEKGGDGGSGLLVSISGALTFYAGGGGGGAEGTGGFGAGGLGGGGRGYSTSDTIRAISGTPNSGGGGGGTAAVVAAAAGNGGTGIVILRYRRNASTVTTPTRTIVATIPNNSNVIRSNLIYYLDAANPVSYPGTGTVWNNIGATNVNGSLRNGPTFVNQHGGYIQFAGGSQDSITSSTPTELQGNPNLTVSGWFRRTAVWPGNQGTWGIGGDVTNQGICSWTASNPNEIVIDVWSSGTFTTGVQYPLQEWVFVTWQKIAGAMTRANCILWRNLTSYTGAALTVLRAETGVPAINNLGITLTRISPTYDSALPVHIGEFLIYNRVLTAGEITHNFNTTRSRYGV